MSREVRGDRQVELHWLKHEAVGQFPRIAIILDSEAMRTDRWWLIWIAFDRIWHFITNLCKSEIRFVITFLLMKRQVGKALLPSWAHRSLQNLPLNI